MSFICGDCGRRYEAGPCMSDDCPGNKAYKRGMITKERYGIEISETYEVRPLEDGRARLYYWCHEFKVWRHAFTLLDEESAVRVGEHMIRNRLEQR